MLDIIFHPVYLVWVWPFIIAGTIFAIITKD
jgi:hypothetical protein